MKQKPDTAKEISPKQRRIITYIAEFMEERGYPPTVRDIMRGAGLSSTSVVDYNLNILTSRGYLRRDPDVSRGIELLERRSPSNYLVTVPVIGQIAAGEPIPVPSSDSWQTAPSGEVLHLPQEITRGKERVFALKVKGTSMIDALIDDGDLVLLQQASTAENGETVAVWLKSEKEVTLKKIYREGSRIRLQPANSQMQPLYTARDNVEVQGKVIAVLRQVA